MKDLFNYFDVEKDDYGRGKATPKIAKMVMHGIIAIVALSFVFGCFGTVSAGEIGVKTRFNRVVGTVQPGLYFKLPFLEDMHYMSVKTRTVNYDKAGDTGDDKNSVDNLFAASKDLQDVAVGVVVNYHLDATKVADIFTQYNSTENYQSNVVEPIIRAVVKATTAEYTAEELVTKRSEVSDKASMFLSQKLAEKNAIVETASITNFEFSKAFSNAIESKVTAVQNAEAAKNKLEQVKFEAQQTIETAKATAEAQRISSAALAAQGGSDYVQLKAIEKWDGHLPEQFVPGATIPFLNLKK